MFSYLVVAVAAIVVGLLAHFVAEQRGRPFWEPWIITSIAAAVALVEVAIRGLGPFLLFYTIVPPLVMCFFPKRGEAALADRSAPCPHCAGQFVVDRRFLGQSVTCPHCRQPFQLPAA